MIWTNREYRGHRISGCGLQILLHAGIVTLIFFCMARHGNGQGLSGFDSGTDLVFHIVDHGIRQHHEDAMLPGQEYSDQHTRLYDRAGVADVLLPMPSDEAMRKMSDSQLQTYLKRGLNQGLLRGRKGGADVFEIQLVQNINALGYFDSDRQALVERFSRAAYGALGDVINEQATQVRSLNIDITAGSNGTVGLVKSADVIKPYAEHIRAVDLIDGRADYTRTLDLIDVVGAEKTSIFNARMDWPAPGPDGTRLHMFHDVMASIGNPMTARELARERPGIAVYQLQRAEPTPMVIGAGHLDRLDPDTRFVVERYRHSNGSMQHDVLGRSVRGSEMLHPVRYTPQAGSPMRPLDSIEPFSGLPVSRWTIPESTGNRFESDLVQSLATAARGAESVLLTGNMGSIESLHHDLSREMPGTRFDLANSMPDPFELNRHARNIQSDLIIEVSDGPVAIPFDNHRYAVPTEHAFKLNQAINTAASSIKDLDTIIPTVDNRTFRALSDAADAIHNPARVAFALQRYGIAVQQDLETHRSGNYSLIRSHVLEETASQALDWMPEALQFAGLSRLADPVSAVSSIGLVDLVRAGATHYGQRRMTVDTAIEYVYALNRAAAWSAGLAATGRIEVANAAADLSDTTARSVGTMTQPHATAWYSMTHGHTQEKLDQYHALAVSNWVRGNAIPSPDQHFSPQELKTIEPAINQIQAEVRNLPLQSMPSSPQPTDNTVSHRHQPPRNLSIPRDSRNQNNMVQNHLMTAIRTHTQDQRILINGISQAERTHLERLSQQVGRGQIHELPRNTSPFAARQYALDFDFDTLVEIEDLHANSRVSRPDEWRRPDDYTSNQSSMPPRPTPAPVGVPSTVGGGFRNRYARDIGGVMLSESAQWAGSDSGPSADGFMMIMESGMGGMDFPSYRRFVTALWAVYFSGDGPGISIDPIGGGSDKHLVRYIGEVVNSDLGRVMREADYLMKKWAVGTDRPDGVDDFRNPDELAAALGTIRAGSSSRFWFIPQEMTFRRDDGAILFERGSMALKTEYLSGAGGSDPANEQFAEYFTDNYWRLASRHPVLEELFEYAKYVSLARYLKDNHVPMLWFLLANRDLVLTEDSPGVVDQLVTQSAHFQDITISGGVDLDIPVSSFNYVMDRETLGAMTPFGLSAQNHGATPMLSSASAPGERNTSETRPELIDSRTMTISGNSARGDVYQTDLRLVVNGRPGLELSRHYNPSPALGNDFGDGWSFLIPYRLEPGTNGRVHYANAQLPGEMKLHNLLTGVQETLHFDSERYSIAGYVPREEAATVSLGLFVLTDGSFRHVDRLGNEFHFNPGGWLVEMNLIGDYTVRYEYDTAHITRQEIQDTPPVLNPHGDDRVSVFNASLPESLEFLDSNREHEIFRFDDNNTTEFVGYLADDPEASHFDFLALLNDASFVLEAKNGLRVRFDPNGQFMEADRTVLSKVICANHEAQFEYEYFGSDFRMKKVYVHELDSQSLTHQIAYNYDEQGRLVQVNSPSFRELDIEYSDSSVVANRRAPITSFQ